MACGMCIRAKALRAAILCFALFPACARAEGIDTEHLFGFMIGSDVGNAGEREFESKTTGRFSRSGGHYRTVGQELAVEFVPVKNFRVEMGTTFASHNIAGVAGLEDRRQLSWQGVSVDLRYRFLDRDSAPFGFTVAIENRADRVDETSAAVVRSYGTEFTLAVDRELIPNVAVAALNLTYQPEWTSVVGTGATERDAALGAALGVMVRARPGLLVGGEARYVRRYEGFGLEELAGQALFIGPTAYLQLSPGAWLTAAWSVQAWGRPAGSNAVLDLVNFERHQARLTFGVNF
jgi:hypothetical protein